MRENKSTHCYPVNQPYVILAYMAHQTTLKTNPPRRIWLFFIAILINLISSAFTGLAHYLNLPLLALFATITCLVWFAMIFAIAIPATENKLEIVLNWLKPLARAVIALLAIVTALEIIGIALVFLGPPGLGESSLGKSIKHSFEPADAMALTQQASYNLLDGKNPYTSSNIITALNSSTTAFDKITPLFKGSFLSGFPYPNADQLRTLWEESIITPGLVPQEIETHQSYPAGSFLLAAPFLALGIHDIRIVYVLLALPAIAYVTRLIKPGFRIYFILGTALSLEIWNAVAGGDTSLLYFPFLLLAWVLLPRRIWISALCMGIAIATKQVAWYFLPFYIILILQRYGFKKSFLTAFLAAGVFSTLNIPFILMNPGAWFASVAAPLRDNLFPEGVGIITIVTSGLVHLTSQTVFSLLEGVTAILCLIWYYRNCSRYPNTALVLAFLPLFFAWRSNWNYFYYADIVLLAAVLLEAPKSKPGVNSELQELLSAPVSP